MKYIVLRDFVIDNMIFFSFSVWSFFLSIVSFYYKHRIHVIKLVSNQSLKFDKTLQICTKREEKKTTNPQNWDHEQYFRGDICRLRLLLWELWIFLHKTVHCSHNRQIHLTTCWIPLCLITLFVEDSIVW